LGYVERGASSFDPTSEGVQEAKGTANNTDTVTPASSSGQLGLAPVPIIPSSPSAIVLNGSGYNPF